MCSESISFYSRVFFFLLLPCRRHSYNCSCTGYLPIFQFHNFPTFSSRNRGNNNRHVATSVHNSIISDCKLLGNDDCCAINCDQFQWMNGLTLTWTKIITDSSDVNEVQHVRFTPIVDLIDLYVGNCTTKTHY